MKRNSAAFLALLLSVSVAAAPSASVLADTAVPEVSVETGVETAEEIAVPVETETVEETAPVQETVDETIPAGENAETEDSGLETAEDAVDSDIPEKETETEEKSEEVSPADTEAEASDNQTETETDQKTETDKETEKETESDAATDAKDAEETEIGSTFQITVATRNAEGTISGMYTMDKTVVTKQADGTYLVRMHQASTNRNLLALTSDKAAATAHEVDWQQGGGEDGYWFVVRIASLSDSITACFSSTDRAAQGKEFGNPMTITFDESTITATEYSEVSASEMNILPAENTEAADDDTSKDDQDKDDTEDSSAVLEDGIYTGLAETGASMFKVTAVKLTSKNGSMTAVVTLSSTGYDYLYLGTKEEAYAADESAWIPAVIAEDGTYTYEIPVSALDTPITVASRSKKYADTRGVDAWYDRTITIVSSSLTKTENLPSDDSDKDTETSITQAVSVTVANADTGAVSGMYSMDSVVVTQQADGSYLVRMHQSRTNRNILALTQDKDKADAHETDWYQGGGEDGYWFVVPVTSLDEPIYAAFSSTDRIAEGKGFSNIMSITFDLSTLTDTDAEEVTSAEISILPVETPEEPDDGKDEEKEEEEKDPDQDETAALEDGTYTGLAETGAAMFKVTAVKLTVKDGSMTAVVSLSGTGYDYLYMGTKEEAYAADKSAWIPAVVDKNGVYTYEIPVSALDTPLTVASRSARYASEGKGADAWLNRSITIVSSSLVKVSDSGSEDTSDDKGNTGNNSGNNNSGGSSSGNNSGSSSSGSNSGSGTNTNKPSGNDGNAEKESEYESDLSGSTAAVDSSTSLKDGVYTPSSFSWSGGTGKVNITCSKVTVTDGKAYATIAFSSSKYGYVKANGNTYYPTVSGGSSIFTIPVELNKNQTIIGMTTAMSTAHEIRYQIYVSIPGAGKGSSNADTSSSVSGMVSSDNTALDEEAPEIIGLEYESETELEEAEYFKIYNYENGITLLEIDLTRDTQREADDEDADEKDSTASKETEDSESADKDGSSTDADDSGESGKTSEEFTAELYKGNVVKYLIVPEDEEIPVGLEKDMVVVQLPVESVYMAADTGFDFLEDLDSLKLITTSGIEEDDCENEAAAKLMQKEKIVYGGAPEKPTFKTILKAETDAVFLSADFLPGNPSDEEDEEELTEEELEKETEEFVSIAEKFALLGIPVIVDRSADEDSDIAKAEWIKVYGALTGNSEEAQKLFEEFTADHQ